MFKYTLDVEYEQIETIVVKELTTALLDGKNGWRNTDPELDLALLRVLRYYTTDVEYNKITKEIF